MIYSFEASAFVISNSTLCIASERLTDKIT